jgi:hypothetical protein
MIYASAASTPARLGIGTAGQVLTVSGGVPAWTTIAAGGVTSVTGTAPIASSGGATPAISLTPGTARQLLQTNAGGTAAEFASNIDIPGTLDVTGVATFDGIASHPLGTAAAPSVTFTGDTDTGFYSPGAGRISLANNGTNTVEVTAAGTVLIGGTLPGSPGIGLGADGSAGFNSNVTFTNNSGIADNIIGMTQVVNSSGTLTNMVLGNGNVLIGGTLPASPNITLSAAGAGTFAGDVQVGTNGGTIGQGGIILNSAGGQVIYATGNTSSSLAPGNFGLIVGTTNSSLGDFKFMVGSNGDVKIGGVLPASPLITLYASNGGATFTGTLGWGSDPANNYLAGSTSGAPGQINSLATYNNTSVNAANMFIASNGNFQRSTSSLRFKTDIETAKDEYADAILQTRPVWFRSKCEKDNPEWGYWGFIAEEVAEIDPRLCFFGEDENGETQVDGVQYDRFVPLLVNLLQRQSQRIEALEAEVAALKGA